MVDTKEQQLVISEDEERRVLTSAFETEMDTTPQPFDLEELGLSDTSQISQQLVKSIVVDYEESDRDDDKLRNVDATCAPSACGPLEEGVARDELSTGRLYRHRSSSDSLKGKSVIFEPNMKIASRITSESDPEQSVHRCVKVPKLCMCEVKLHRSLESCWLVSSGHVYDVTGLVTAHPGGIDSILRKAGGPDCAQDMKFHSKRARKMMEKCYIGKLARCGDEVDEATCNVM
ncbi:hypothetical protein PsorP6_018539 [Peronosclerospora sorghi]|nr:hypothetical protein PsorP6_018539 [Peronosclerospora sorghi]